MAIVLMNDKIKVVIEKQGAQLCSMQINGDETEYIWKADPVFWGRHAPILFPIVGQVVSGEYLVNNQIYKLGQHGFARDMDFDVLEESKEKVILVLPFNDTSLALYPYRFELRVIYSINDQRLEIEYEVYNKDTKTIYFSIGGHPGFNCPLQENESFQDYYFQFEKAETLELIQFTKDGLFSRDKVPSLVNQNKLAINQELFKKDALVYQGLISNKIWLKSEKSAYSVLVDFDGFPFLGLWSKPTGAPFVCIEPWFGHTDYADFKGDFSIKEDNQALLQGDCFRCTYGITIENQ